MTTLSFQVKAWFSLIIVVLRLEFLCNKTVPLYFGGKVEEGEKRGGRGSRVSIQIWREDVNFLCSTLECVAKRGREQHFLSHEKGHYLPSRKTFLSLLIRTGTVCRHRERHFVCLASTGDICTRFPKLWWGCCSLFPVIILMKRMSLVPSSKIETPAVCRQSWHFWLCASP